MIIEDEVRVNGEWKYFTNDEINSTGGRAEGMCPLFMRKISLVRHEYGRPFHLFPNGLNSGRHKAIQHPKGQAMDFHTLDPNIGRLMFLFGKYGLKGIGVYKNHLGIYSFHVDDRPLLTMWSGVRKKAGEPWTYGALELVL